jgi:hypothetical protein
LDAELQAFLADYLKRPKADVAYPVEEEHQPPTEIKNVDDLADDIPWRDEVEEVVEDCPF